MTGIIPLGLDRGEIDEDTLVDDSFLYSYILEYQKMLDWIDSDDNGLADLFSEYVSQFQHVPIHEMFLRVASRLMLSVGYSESEIIEEMETAILGTAQSSM